MRVLLALCTLIFVISVAKASEPILPVVAPSVDEGQAALGKQLFHDPKLSSDGQISCASCHDLDAGGVDGLQFSVGVLGKEGVMNAPTVFNSALNFRQFWNGRANTLEEQVNGPLTNPVEMDNTWDAVLTYLRQDDDYNKTFSTLYDDGVTADNVRHSIAEFERSLTLTNARFDQYLQGISYAITDEEKHGYALFKSYGCVACHQGMAVGGNLFQEMGIFTENNVLLQEEHELGVFDRYAETNNPKDKHVFKVPSLRLVTLTAPYFHDGSAQTLFEAIQLMGEYQLGRVIPDADIHKIEAFLATLVGKPQGDSVE